MTTDLISLNELKEHLEIYGTSEDFEQKLISHLELQNNRIERNESMFVCEVVIENSESGGAIDIGNISLPFIPRIGELLSLDLELHGHPEYSSTDIHRRVSDVSYYYGVRNSHNCSIRIYLEAKADADNTLHESTSVNVSLES